MLDNLIAIFKDRARLSEDYYDENYPEGNRISNANETDNQSWEIGFYAGIQFAIDELYSEISRQETQTLMTGGNDVN